MGKRMFGPLSGSVVEAFRAELFDQGYRSSSAENVIAVMRDLSRWLSDEGMSPGELTDALLEHFAAARRAGGHRRHLCATQLAPVMEFLRREGLSPPPALPVPTPVSSLVADYRAWLVHERGLAARTVARYEKTAARLLSEHAVVSDGRGVKTLTAGQVRSFLLRDCPALGPGSAKGRAGEVRALLKFLFIVGYTPVPLAAAVPSVAGRRDGSLPRTVGAEVVVSLLASCDRSRATGRRDFAILTLLARLGLRSAEVAGLDLDDIDWRAGELAVKGKSRRADRLPMPVDVGEALVGYLTDGRPAIDNRCVFVRCRAPLTGIHSTTVSTVVRMACRRVGLPPLSAHPLRHALGAETLRRGGSLAEISQLLRHRDLATTAVYAKVDRETLRTLAQPWPGAR